MKATEYVLSGFRHFYPDAPIILVSDGGDDFSHLAEKYSCTYFWREHIPCFRGLTYGRNGWYLWWAEFRKYMCLLDTEFMIFLEDDVDIRKHISSKKLMYDINGLSESILTLDILDPQFAPLCKTTVGGQGGSIFRMSFLTKLLSTDLSDEFNLLERILNSGPINGHWATDIVFSFLTHRLGGTMGEWDGYCRTLDSDYEEKFNQDRIEILHIYKVSDYQHYWLCGLPERYKHLQYTRPF